MKRIRKNDRQLRLLSQSIFMEEASGPRIVGMTMRIVSLSIVGFVIWAAVAQLDEVTSASGEVVPNGYVQLVQHLEGGIVADIPVKEGDLVSAGQVLVRVKASGAVERLSEFTERQMVLRLQAERLRAFINHRVPAYENDTEIPAGLIAGQLAIFQEMVGALETEMEIVQKQKRQKGEAIQILKVNKETIQANFELVKEARDIKEGLLAKGLASRQAYSDKQQRLTTLQGEYDVVIAEIRRTESELLELDDHLGSILAPRFAEVSNRLEALESEIFLNQETIAKLKNVVDRLEVLSPTNGLVKGVDINTIGGVISPGQTLMEIVPIDQILLGEVRVLPQDIGHVRVDQPVRVKVSSFDFSRYGTIDGVVESLSATTFDDQRSGPYYRARIVLDRNYVGGRENQNRILPGMTIDTDIVTGAKTILEYLLKPVHRSLSAALTER